LVSGFSRLDGAQRRYRVDATILLCGVPIFTRKNVGGGYASVETAGLSGTFAQNGLRREPGSNPTEVRSAPFALSSARAFGLQFGAGCLPARAAGLNRFGILREVVREQAGQPHQFAFSGLMTHSPEQSLEEGRHALVHTPPPSLDAVLAFGEMKNGSAVTSTSHVQLPAESTWTGVGEQMAALLSGSRPVTPIERTAGLLPPFLYVMYCAGRTKETRFTRGFLHGGKPYFLDARRQPSHPGELRGEIRDEARVKCADFRASYAVDDDCGIPSRIEYRARPFLRLVFEADRAADQPPIPSVFGKESA
jgi:hypothetical protein